MPSSNKLQEKTPCSTKNMPVPEIVICSYCKEEAEVWTDEPDAVCPTCKQSLK